MNMTKMKTKLVNRNAAEILADNGFDICCDYVYWGTDTPMRRELLSTYDEHVKECPSLDIVRQWFDEKHNIRIEVTCTIGDRPNEVYDDYQYKLIIMDNFSGIGTIIYPLVGGFKTYESAFNSAIIRACACINLK